MLKRGTILAILGLLFGLLTGFGILALKRYAARQLVEMLEHETAISCDCQFKVDSIDVSLLTLSATARNARIVSGGDEKFGFRRIYASFNISRIREHLIDLSDLRLIDGYAKGVGPESETFRFIDNLAAPLPPEKDYPGRWKLKLQRLHVINSRFVEQFGTSELRGQGVAVDVFRTSTNDFDLKPTVAKLTIRSQIADNPPRYGEFQLGKVSTSLLLTDHVARFGHLRLAQDAALLDSNATIPLHGDAPISGEAKYRFDSRSLGMPDWLFMALTGEGKFKGPASTPIFEGEIRGAETPAFAIRSSGADLLRFDRFSMRYQASISEGAAGFTVSALEGASDPDQKLSLLQPLTLTSRGLSGSLDLAVGSISTEGLTFSDVLLTVTAAGTLENPKLTVNGTVAGLSSNMLTLPNLTVHGQREGEHVRMTISHQSEERGSANLSLDLKPIDALVEKGSLDFKQFSVFSGITAGAVTLDGAISLHGPTNPTQLEGEGTIELSSASFAPGAQLALEVKLAKGLATASAANQAKSFTAKTAVDLTQRTLSKIELALTDFSPHDYNPSIDCLTLTSHFQYSFRSGEFDRGSGALGLEKIDVGCRPYQIMLPAPANVPIRDGTFTFPDVHLTGGQSNVSLNGSLSLQSGFRLDLGGSLRLNSLLGLLPSVDDLRGVCTASLNIRGPLTFPIVSGNAKVTEGELGIESADLSVDSVNGEIDVSEGRVSLRDLSGNLNGGTFSIFGTIRPLAIQNSEIGLKLKDVLITPSDNSSVVFSGDLTVGKLANDRPGLSGHMIVESAEFQKNIDFATLIKSATSSLFRSRSDQQRSSRLPALDLDVSVTAPHNLLITTNWFTSELKGDLSVSGTLDNPLMRGKLETLSGWFRIKDRRFDISSGELQFRPGMSEPQLEIIGETYIGSRIGETTLVIMEINGPLTNPRILFSSDKGISQREILNLITSGGTLADEVLSRVTDNERQSIDPASVDESFLAMVPKFFQNLTRIDSLSLEPTYSVQRGTTEPTVIARKRLNDKMELRGESSLGGTITEAKLGVLYELARSLTFAVFAETVSTRDNSAIAVDLIYTAFGRRRTFLDITVTGNDHLSDNEIEAAARLTVSSRLPLSEIAKITKNITTYYRSQGFFHTTVDARCVSGTEFCRELEISVVEGPPTTVAAYKLMSADEALPLITEEIERLQLGRTASEGLLETARSRLTKVLRSEGYIAARITPRFTDPVTEGESSTTTMEIAVSPGKPVSFTFRGNSIFGAEDFLDTINLFRRKIPFGNNTINILIENIDRMYREAGYLYSAISYSRDDISQPDRVNYIIDIVEEQKVPVSKVQFSGILDDERDEFARWLERRTADSTARLLKPRFAVEEEIAENAHSLTSYLIDQGYPEAAVEFHIVPQERDKGGAAVAISYEITKNEAVKAQEIVVGGLPETIVLPPLPALPYSIPRIDLYIDALVELLKGSGYQYPSVTGRLVQESQKMEIEIEPGPLTHIASIRIEGERTVEDEVIRRALTFKEGDAWNSDVIASSKRRLLKLGLFSRVDIDPADGALDSDTEPLVIKLSEHALQSFEFGGGLNSEYGLHLFGEAIDRSLFHDGKSLALRVDTYYDRASAEVSQGIAGLQYTDPAFAGGNYTHTEDLRYQKLDITTQEFNLDRFSLASYVYRSWEGGLTHSFGHTILQDNLSDVSPGAIISDLDTGIVRISFLSGDLTFDHRDDPLNPNSGFLFNFDYELASRMLASDANFYAVGGRAAYLAPFHVGSREFTAAINSRVASAWTYGGTEEIPITQRYYLGGRNSIRGFRENSLGPRGDDGAVIGGDLLVANNFELRYHYQENLTFLTFLDAGTVYLKDRAISIDDMRESVGLGVRYISAIGPIGLDVGHALDERSGEPGVRVHFTIGSNF